MTMIFLVLTLSICNLILTDSSSQPFLSTTEIEIYNIYLVDPSGMDEETRWNIAAHLRGFTENENKKDLIHSTIVTKVEEGLENEMKKNINYLTNKRNELENKDLKNFNLYIIVKELGDFDIENVIKYAEKTGINVYIIFLKNKHAEIDYQKNIVLKLDGDYHKELFDFLLKSQGTKNFLNKEIKNDDLHGIHNDEGDIVLWFLLLIIIGPSIFVFAFVMILCRYCCKGSHHHGHHRAALLTV
jgi:hypothetical protein